MMLVIILSTILVLLFLLLKVSLTSKHGGDIRDVINIGKLVRKNDGPSDIEQIMQTIMVRKLKKKNDFKGTALKTLNMAIQINPFE